ncbi:MAG: hypothetical protein B7X79_18015 [Acidovorax sp. 17-64-282]|nr:MAG: hypothetical protein B7X79_18015 [Acidovorax sp. 17-64-282]
MSETGSIWITLDDNEVHRARMVLDEIFGADNFVATCIWQKNFSPKNTAQFFSEDHDYVLVYAKDKRVWRPNLLERTAEMDARYSNPDNHPRGPWTSGDLSARNYYSEGTYPVTAPSGRVFDGPPPGRYWGISKEKFLQLDVDNCIWWGEDGNNMPRLKRFQQDVKQGRTPQTLWFYDEVGHTQDAKKTLIEMGLLKDQESTITPKPVALIERILELSSTPDSIVLDSFAGSGTTAHAVLKANARDNGNRRFILIEGEDYADRLTAERVRRAIRGYAWQGTQHETLLEEKINFTQFKKRHAAGATARCARVLPERGAGRACVAGVPARPGVFEVGRRGADPAARAGYGRVGTCAAGGAGGAGRAQAPPGVCACQVFEQCAIARAGHRVCGAAVCIVPSGVRPWHNKSVFCWRCSISTRRWRGCTRCWPSRPRPPSCAMR